MPKIIETPVEETENYENFLNQSTAPKQNHLDDFLDIDDTENPEKEWQKHWKEMPEFENNNNNTYKQIIVNFRNEEDYQEFAKLINQHLTKKTKSIWHPKLDRTANSLMRWIEVDD